MNRHSGAILVLSGPSGAGKSSLINKIKDHIGPTHFSISTTTRGKREGEEEGVHYYFVDVDEFKSDIEQEMFLEYAVVHGNYYGTSLGPVKKALKRENSLFLILMYKDMLPFKTGSVISLPPFLSPPLHLKS